MGYSVLKNARHFKRPHLYSFVLLGTTILAF